MDDQAVNQMEEALYSVMSTDKEFTGANMTDGLFAIARAIERNAAALERLGLNGATSDMGAMELVGYELKRIADRMEANDDV